MSSKAIVLDANILIRAVLGRRVRELIFNNFASVNFFLYLMLHTPTRESTCLRC